MYTLVYGSSSVFSFIINPSLKITRNFAQAKTGFAVDVLATTKPIDPIIGIKDKSRHISILNDSLEKLTGIDLYERMRIVNGDASFEDICRNNRFVLISHNTEKDPIYNFGNEACLEAFARSWNELCVTPSRESVVINSEDEELRIKLMSKVTTEGFVECYGGKRVRGDGKFIQLVNAVVWNCYDETGEYYGQACLFDLDKAVIM